MMSESQEPGAPQIISKPGALPPFWDRQAVFVANLLGLFFGNEDQARQLAEEVGEVDSYGGRLIPVIDLLFHGGGPNLLVLEREPDPALCRYFEQTAGLTLPECQILPHADYLRMGEIFADGGVPDHDIVERLSNHSAAWMDGYVTDEILASIAQETGKTTIASHEGSRKGNNKRELLLFLEAAGLPVVDTEMASSPAEIEDCLARLRRKGFTGAVIKSALGASGIGLLKVEGMDEANFEAPEVPGYFFFEGDCLVQGWLKPGEFGITTLRSPSVQFFLSDDAVMLYDITEQILTRSSVHEGNESPPPYLSDAADLEKELLRQAGVAGEWLHRCGYRGTGSVDFLTVDRQDGSTDVYVCEINARVTGATYPSVLARHFMPEGAWLLRNLRFEEPLTGEVLLARLSEKGDLFVPGESEVGVMPVNFNFGNDGLVHKGQFLCLAHSSAGSRILLRLAELGLPCLPDRD